MKVAYSKVPVAGSPVQSARGVGDSATNAVHEALEVPLVFWTMGEERFDERQRPV